MIDLITYCHDVDELKKELINSGRVDEEGNPVLNSIKVPVRYSVDGKKTISLVRCLTPECEASLQLNNLEILGTYDEVFADPDKLARYTSVYSITPVVITDENGEEVIYHPPKKFGVFA